MSRGGVGQVGGDFVQSLVDLLVERKGNPGLGDELGLVLGGVADGLVGMDAIEEADLGAGGGKFEDGVVIGTEGIFEGAWAGFGEEAVEGLLVAIEAGFDPGLKDGRCEGVG